MTKTDLTSGGEPTVPFDVLHPHDRHTTGFPPDDYAVAIDDDLIVVGARVDEVQGPYSGSAYVYRLSGKSWVEEAKLLASDGYDYDSFGWSVAVDHGRVVVGAQGNGRSGAAYYFDQSTGSWSERQKLVASDVAANRPSRR